MNKKALSQILAGFGFTLSSASRKIDKGPNWLAETFKEGSDGGGIRSWERLADTLGVSLDYLRGRTSDNPAHQPGAPSHSTVKAPGAGEKNATKEMRIPETFPKDTGRSFLSASGGEAGSGGEFFMVEFAGQSRLVRRPSVDYWLCRKCLNAHPEGYSFCPHTGHSKEIAEDKAPKRAPEKQMEER